MGIQQKMQSFFKRKREEEVVQDTCAPDALALVVFVNQRQDEAGQGNHMQDEEEQENPTSQDEEEGEASEPVIFRGMEFLERDPALRPQVWQYPSNQRDDVRLVHSTKVLLEKMRSDEGWDVFILTVIEFCVEHGVDFPDMEATYILRGGRARRQPDHFTTERYLRVEIYRATIDSQLTELNLRFNEKVMDLLSISITLIPKNGFRSFSAKEICSMVEKYYPADFTQQERHGLELQLNRFVVDAKNSEELRKPATITTLCRCLVETGRDRIYNFLDRLLRLLVTLPVSTASAERAFSSLKIIKSRLRNRMEDDLLADSMLLQIEREIALKISYEDVIVDLKAKKNRRGFL